MIPREHIFPVFFICVWIYLNYYEPLFLPIGLFILVAYSQIPSFSKNENENENEKKKNINI